MKLPDAWTLAMYAVALTAIGIFVALTPNLSTIATMEGGALIGVVVLVVFTLLKRVTQLREKNSQQS